MRVVYSRAARRDLAEIHLFIEQASGRSRAKDVLRQIRTPIDTLTDQPLKARLRPELGEGVRGLVVLSWLVFYRVRKDDVQILRVIHQARDLRRIRLVPGEGEAL